MKGENMAKRKILFLFIAIFSVALVACTGSKYKPEYVLNSISSSPDGLMLACGDNGIIATTQDLKVWNYLTIDKNIKFESAEFLNDEFIILGREAANGKDVLCFYHPKSKKWSLTQADDHVRNITVANNRLFTISTEGYIKELIYKSEWEPVEFPAIINDANEWPVRNIPSSILYDGHQYIVTGGGNFLASSKDLKEWVFNFEQSGGTGSSYGIATSGSTNVIVGDHLYIASAKAGDDQWTVQDPIEHIANIEDVDNYYTLCLFDIVTDGKKFVAVGAHGIALISEDGINWSVSQTNTFAWLKDIAWNGTSFICLGENIIIASDDGVNWTEIK